MGVDLVRRMQKRSHSFERTLSNQCRPHQGAVLSVMHFLEKHRIDDPNCKIFVCEGGS